jgi:hypothetical protein
MPILCGKVPLLCPVNYAATDGPATSAKVMSRRMRSAGMSRVLYQVPRPCFFSQERVAQESAWPLVLARVDRLDKLARGLAKELTLIRQADDPLLHVEQKGYLDALGRVRSGVEEARAVLARTRQRLEDGCAAGGR